MLNGIAPILIFTFESKLPSALLGTFSGLPVLNKLAGIGIPIPLYLDENLTGIYVESESKALDIETKAQPKYDGDEPSVDQRGLDNTVTINLFANRDSILLSVLLAMTDMVFAQVVSKTYSVTYINGATLVFNGLLNSFTVNEGSDDNLMRISMQISKANKSPPTKAKPASLKNSAGTGTTPPGVGAV